MNHSNPILPSMPWSCKWPFSFGFPTKTLYILPPLPMRATCPAHLILLDLICLTISGYEYKLCATFSILPLHHTTEVQIFPSAPCSQPPSVCALPLMSQTKFHTHTKQLSELWFCIFLTFTFPDIRREDRRLRTEWQQAFPEFSLLLISSCMQFWSVSVVLRYLNFATSSKHQFAVFMLYFFPIFWLRDINIRLVSNLLLTLAKIRLFTRVHSSAHKSEPL
jgi:hypothetical protein